MANLAQFDGAKRVGTRAQAQFGSVDPRGRTFIGLGSVPTLGIVTCVGDEATGRRGCGDDALAWGVTNPPAHAMERGARRRPWLYDIVRLDSSEQAREYLASAENVAWLLQATQTTFSWDQAAIAPKVRLRTAPGSDEWRLFDLDAEYPGVVADDAVAQMLLGLRGPRFQEQRTHQPIGLDAVLSLVNTGFAGFINDITEGVFDEFDLFELKSNSSHQCPARRTPEDFGDAVDAQGTVDSTVIAVDVDPDA